MFIDTVDGFIKYEHNSVHADDDDDDGDDDNVKDEYWVGRTLPLYRSLLKSNDILYLLDKIRAREVLYNDWKRHNRA